MVNLHSPKDIDLEVRIPLIQSADLINQVANVICSKDQVDRKECLWYHSVWQYLRLFNMVSSPTWHNAFYIREITKSICKESLQALITGTADYTMLAYVAKCLSVQTNLYNIQVLDNCPTPLFACNWYARKEGFNVRTWEKDILDSNDCIAENSIDLICTDAFLTRFQLLDARNVLKIWNSLLCINGRVITTIRVNSGLTNKDIEKSIGEYKDKAFQKAKQFESFLRLTPNEISLLAEAYARKMHSENLGGAQEICNYFLEAGFRIDQRNLQEVPGELYSTTYLQLACSKK